MGMPRMILSYKTDEEGEDVKKRLDKRDEERKKEEGPFGEWGMSVGEIMFPLLVFIILVFIVLVFIKSGLWN